MIDALLSVEELILGSESSSTWLGLNGCVDDTLIRCCCLILGRDVGRCVEGCDCVLDGE